MTAIKIVWALGFAVSLILYALLFFGAASGGSNNPPMMALIWSAVAVGLVCGVLTLVGFVTAKGVAPLSGLVALIALWPLGWLSLAIVKAILR